MRRLFVVVSLAPLFALSACLSTAADEGCTSGEVKACTCAEGGEGLRSCTTSGAWDACVCDGDGGVDAGATDAGPADGGEVDAGPSDGGTTDAGPDDGGATDAGPADAGPDAGFVACASDDDCAAPAACIAGGCVGPVDDPAAYAAEAAERPASYAWQITFPDLDAATEECCFDLDADGLIDDRFAGVLRNLAAATNVDLQAELDEAVASGELVRAVDWVSLPDGLADGDVRLSIFGGVLEPDGSGQLPDVATRAAGGVRLLLDPASFGAYGAEHQFNSATLVDGRLEGHGGSFDLGIRLLDTPVTLRVRDAKIEAQLTQDTAACSGVCSSGPARLGGAVHAEDLAAMVDGVLRTCTCTGLDPSLPVVEATQEASGWKIGCTDNRGAGAGSCASGDPCAQVGTVCQLLPYLLGPFDLDTDDDGVMDAQSMGLEVDMSGARIDGLAP